MASAKPKKTTKHDKDHQYTIINNFYLNDCQGVMVGSQNQQFAVFDCGAELIDQPQEALRHGFKTDQVVVAMLNSILNPERKMNPCPVPLQKLEDAFNKLYGNVRHKRRFKEITGLNLLPFLRKKPEKFKLMLRESNWLVMPIPLENSVEVSSICEGGQTALKGIKAKESQTRAISPDQTLSKSIGADSISLDNETETPVTTDDGWILVTKKRNKDKQVPSCIVTKAEKKNPSKQNQQQVTYADVVTRKTSTKPKQKKVPSSNASDVKEKEGIEHNLPSSPFTQNGNAVNVEETEAAFQVVMTAVDNFRKGHFVFMTGRIEGSALASSVEVFTTIPWIAVFDFDEESRDQGLLSRVEGPLTITRSLHFTSWRDPVKISEKATTWYFIRGNRAIPDSRFDKGYSQWWKQVNPSISSLALEIARFVEDTTVLKVVVIWDDANAQYINYLVCKLDEYIQEHVKFIICINDETSDASSQAHLRHMKDQVDENITVVNISALNLFLGLSDHIKKCSFSKKKYGPCEIPTANDCGNTVDEKGFAWLNEYMDIIYMTMDQEKSGDSDIDLLEEDAHQFFRGGTLKWETRFLCGSEYLDVERDAMEKITVAIKLLVLSFKSGLYTLHHAPGAGGSTVAQRVLWELRDTSPCVQVHFHLGASVADMAHRLEYLYEKTHLPIIALVDGDDEPFVFSYPERKAISIQHV